MAYRVTFAAALLAMAVLAATVNATTIASGNARRSGTTFGSASRKLRDDCTGYAVEYGACGGPALCCPDNYSCREGPSGSICQPVGSSPIPSGPEGTAGVSRWWTGDCVILNAANTGSSVVCGGNHPDASCCSADACYDSTSWDQHTTPGPFQSLEAIGKLTCSQQYEPACCPLAPQGP